MEMEKVNDIKFLICLRTFGDDLLCSIFSHFQDLLDLINTQWKVCNKIDYRLDHSKFFGWSFLIIFGMIKVSN